MNTRILADLNDRYRPCPRCDARFGLCVPTEDRRELHCYRCGYAHYADANLRLGDKSDTVARDGDIAALVRGWAKGAGLDWSDAAIAVQATPDGVDVTSSADVDFAARWRAAFAALSAP